jgi:hypothetical protein
MPLSEDQQASFGVMWFCAIGLIITILLKSPVGFLFVFGLMFTFFGMAKTLGSAGATRDLDDIEMRPLEEGRKFHGDTTLGELLSKY